MSPEFAAWIDELRRIVDAMPPVDVPPASDDWRYGYGNPTLAQLAMAIELPEPPEDWAQMLHHLGNWRDASVSLDGMWDAVGEVEKLRRMLSDSDTEVVRRDRMVSSLRQEIERLGRDFDSKEQSLTREIDRLADEIHRLDTEIEMRPEEPPAMMFARLPDNHGWPARLYRIEVMEAEEPDWIDRHPITGGPFPRGPFQLCSRQLTSWQSADGNSGGAGVRFYATGLWANDVGKQAIVAADSHDDIGIFVNRGFRYDDLGHIARTRSSVMGDAHLGTVEIHYRSILDREEPWGKTNAVFRYQLLSAL